MQNLPYVEIRKNEQLIDVVTLTLSPKNKLKFIVLKKKTEERK